jgi:hypothetical protein
VYPTTGTAQITGVQLPLITGARELMYVLKRIQMFVGSDIEPVIEDYNINMMNFKYVIRGLETEEIKLNILARHFTRIMEGTAQPTPPYPISFTTSPTATTSFIVIRFITPCNSKKVRNTLFKIFTKKKVNVFASPTFEHVVELARYIDRVLSYYWPEIIYDTSRRRQVECRSFTETEIDILNRL